MKRACLAVAAALALWSAPSAAPQAGRLQYKGVGYSAEDLPESLSPAARSAVETWFPWASAARYRMHLEDGERVLLLSAGGESQVDKRLALAQRVGDLLDAKLPRAAGPLSGSAEKPKEPAPDAEGPLPEDPEGGPFPWEEAGLGAYDAPDETPVFSYTWGAVDLPPDGSTIVFLVVRNDGDLLALLEFLERGFPYLDPWVDEMRERKFAGFSLQQPLAGAYVESASGQEEWNPDNELVNRMAQLFLLRRFGQLPNWLVQGWAWWCELEIQKSVYCFPYREEFVGVEEHTDWDRDLQRLFEERAKKPLRIDELAGWRRGSYDTPSARVAWGTVEYLIRFRPEALPRLAEELRAYADQHGRREHGDGTWERITDYSVPADVQKALLEKHAGAAFFREATRFFAEGDDFAPKRD